MIISDTRQFAFLHNPKCAGTTVRERLARFDTTGNFFWMFDEYNGLKFDKAHAPLFIIRHKYPTYLDVLNDYFVFAFVRNPYERLVSAFGEIDPDFVKGCMQLGDHKTYKTCLNSFVKSIRPDHIVGTFFPLRHFILQKNIMYVGRKRMADLVMPLENWPGCLEALKRFDALVADELASAETKNARKHNFGSVDELLDRDSRRHCAELYAEDFEIFGYDRADGALREAAPVPQLSVA